MTTATKPAKRPGNVHLLLRPLRQAPRLVPASPRQGVPRPLASGQGRQGAPEARHRQDQGAAWPARRLRLRHRAGLRHRRLRDGDVVHAGRARRRRAGLGELRQGLGDGHRQAAQAQGPARARGRVRQAARSRQGRFRARRAVHVERHHVRACAFPTATGSRPSAAGSPSPMPPRPSSRSRSTGRRSMSPPSPGRRCWAGRPRTAC